MKTLAVTTERLGTVTEVIHYLQAVENAYNHMYAFDLLVEEIRESTPDYAYWSGRRKRTRTIRRIKDPSHVILPTDRLMLIGISVASPGFWEFAGSLNPLETLRKYFSDRHERRKDRNYREASEAERMELENERLKIEIVKEKVDLLRKAGVAEDRIREALTRYVVAPLGQLDHFQDVGLIESAEMRDDKKES